MVGKLGWWISMDVLGGRPVPGSLLGLRRRRRRRRRKTPEEEAAAEAQYQQDSVNGLKILGWIALILVALAGTMSPLRLGTLLSRPELWAKADSTETLFTVSYGLVTVYCGLAILFGRPQRYLQRWAATGVIFAVLCAGCAIGILTKLISI